MNSKRFLPLLTLILLASFALVIPACKTKLEPGGAYSPVVTNADGTITPTQAPDVALALADQTYKFAYNTVMGVCELERNNRAELWKVSPKIKETLDQVRPVAVQIDQRWARARQAYLENPTPAGLTGIKLAIAEINRLLPVAQTQLATITASQSH